MRAISPVLSVLMMIAVAIAGALVVYAWVMGYIGLSTERAGEAIEIQSTANLNGDLLVFVQNVGEGVVQLEEASCMYVNGRLVPCTISGVTLSKEVATLEKGETATLTYVDGAAFPGEKVTVKVTTLRGTPAEKSAYPGGSARASPVLDHFEFDTIASPQTSGVPFSVTVRAIDQYGNAFTSYSGFNIIYSDWPSSGLQISVINWGTGWISSVITYDINITGSAADITIGTAAVSDPSKNGTSNAFDVYNWLVGWKYRKSHTIYPATGAGTNYQVPIVVAFGPGVDGGDRVYLDGYCQLDFDDIRFTDNDGVTQLDYWIQEYTESDSAVFWVEIADDLSNSDVTIYIYYGNESVSTTSDGEATFIFFDDFEDGSVDTNKWDIMNGTPTESGGQLHLEGNEIDADEDKIWSDRTFGINMAVVAKVSAGPNFGHIPNLRSEDGYDDAITAYRSNSQWVFNTRIDRNNIQARVTGADSDWHLWEIRWTADKGQLINTDGSEWDVVLTENVPTSAHALYLSVMGGESTGNYADVEFVLVRNYVYPEPSHGDWGEEEFLLSG